MDFANIPLFSMMKTGLNYMAERQNVLAQNIANADTPGYKAKDVVAPDFKQMASDAGNGPVKQLHMMTTNPKHIAKQTASAASFKTIKRHTTDELNPNGNNVGVEEEMSKVAQNQADYQKMLNLYSKAVTMFKTAIGNPNSGA